MNMVPLLIAASVLGVKWGWQPVEGGGIEYIVRIEPHAIESLRSGRDIFSDLPPQLQRVRSYRVTVSDKPVPHEGELPPGETTVPAIDVPPVKPAATEQSVLMPPSGPAGANTQPVTPASANEPFADTPLGDQPPTTFQNPTGAAPPGLPQNQPPAWPSPPTVDELRAAEAPPGPSLQPAASGVPNRPGENRYEKRLIEAEQKQDERIEAERAGADPADLAPKAAQAPRASAATNDWFAPPPSQTSKAGLPSRTQPASESSSGGYEPFARQKQGSPFSTTARHATSPEQFASPGQSQTATVATTKPWIPLLATLIGLFASIGLNVYLGMIAWDLYERYRTIVDQLKSANATRVAPP